MDRESSLFTEMLHSFGSNSYSVFIHFFILFFITGFTSWMEKNRIWYELYGCSSPNSLMR
jgi:hypothetical protein